jgi:hypothetical protein
MVSESVIGKVEAEEMLIPPLRLSAFPEIV